MNIAVASGKGGTGKTTVATNLAYLASRNGGTVAYLDCDVEDPNGHIFLRPTITERKAIGNLIPRVDDEKCTSCGECGRICQYSAIVCLGEKVLVFPELCHGCGGCTLVCPADAITEVVRETGILEAGTSGPIRFVRGLLNIGEAMSPPLIRAVKAATPPVDTVIIDVPPGTSCPVVESVRGSDYVILVAEPTPFGLNDLKLAAEMVRTLKLSFGVVINRADLGDGALLSYCREKRIDVLEEIPDDRRIAEAYSRGEIISQALPSLQATFLSILTKVERKSSP